MSASVLQLKLFLLLFFLLVCCLANEYDADIDGGQTLMVEHAFGAEAEFSVRGTITIRSVTQNQANFIQEPVSLQDMDQLQVLAENDGIYRIRVPTKQTGYVSTFVKACSLYESGLSDIIRLHMDESTTLLGISMTTVPALCQGVELEDVEDIVTFNTSVEITQMVSGPTPDTATYLQKLNKERESKAKGEQDNRSFLAKYWMYIVPVVIFMLISSAADPNAAGGGR